MTLIPIRNFSLKTYVMVFILIWVQFFIANFSQLSAQSLTDLSHMSERASCDGVDDASIFGSFEMQGNFELRVILIETSSNTSQFLRFPATGSNRMRTVQYRFENLPDGDGSGGQLGYLIIGQLYDNGMEVNNAVTLGSVVVKDTPPLTATAGSDQTVCSPKVTLNATPVDAEKYIGTWTVSPAGPTLVAGSSVNDPDAIFENLTLGANTFTWTVSNIGGGTCPSPTGAGLDTVIITYESPTTAMAGDDAAQCETNAFSYKLQGNEPNQMFPGQSGEIGEWTVVSGAGTFVNPTQFDTEVMGMAVGENVFRWTITNLNCSPDVVTSDEVTITFRQLTDPVVPADEAVCLDTNEYQLNGNAVATGETGTWSTTQTGVTFTPNANDPSAKATGLATGTYDFTWTITDSESPPCAPKAATQNVQIKLKPIPVSALNQTVCNDMATLDASATNLNPTGWTGQWVIGAGTGNITDKDAHTTTVTGLTLTKISYVWRLTDDDGICSPVDMLQVNVDFPIIITEPNAGPDQLFVCEDNITLAANAPTNDEVGTWSFIGTAPAGAVITDVNDPNTTVTGLPFTADFMMKWTINSLDTSVSCPPKEDQVQIRVQQLETPNAGPKDFNCLPTYTLAAIQPTAPLQGEWTLPPGITRVNPSDPLTKNDLEVTGFTFGSSYNFTWTISDTSGTCGSAASDTVTISWPNDKADPGFATDQCSSTFALAANANPLTNGNITGAWRVVSITDENGMTTTIDAADAVQATYFNGSRENANAIVQNAPTDGSITLEWTITNNTCSSPTTNSAQITYNVFDIGTPNAGSDQNICGTTTQLNAGALKNGVKGTWTGTKADGTSFAPTDFTPSANDPNATVSNLQSGENNLKWTIEQDWIVPVCKDAIEDIVIIKVSDLGTNDAGSGGDECSSTFVLDADDLNPNTTGQWTIDRIGGQTPTRPTSFYIVDVSNPKSRISRVPDGTLTLTWSVIDNKGGNCTSAVTDQVTYEVTNIGGDPSVFGKTATDNPDPIKVCANAPATTGELLLKGSVPPPWATGEWTIDGAAIPISDIEISDGTSGINPQNYHSALLKNIPINNTPRTLTWTVTENSGISTCEKSVSVQIVGGTSTVANANTSGTAPSGCGGNITLDANVPAIGETGKWSIKGGYTKGVFESTMGPTSNKPDDTFIVTNDGTMTQSILEWSIDGGNGCAITTSEVTVTALTSPFVDAGTDETVSDKEYMLKGNTVTSPFEGEWFMGKDASGTPFSMEDSPTVSLALGENYFTRRVTDTRVAVGSISMCRSATKTVKITREATIAEVKPGGLVCAGTPFELEATDDAGYTGTWSFDPPSNLINIADPKARKTTVTTTGLGEGGYVFVWTVDPPANPSPNDVLKAEVIYFVPPSGEQTLAKKLTLCGTQIFLDDLPVPNVSQTPRIIAESTNPSSTTAELFDPTTNTWLIKGMDVIGTYTFQYEIGTSDAGMNTCAANYPIIIEKESTASQQVMLSDDKIDLCFSNDGDWDTNGLNGFLQIANNNKRKVDEPATGGFEWSVKKGGQTASNAILTRQTVSKSEVTINLKPNGVEKSGTYQIIYKSINESNCNGVNEDRMLVHYSHTGFTFEDPGTKQVDGLQFTLKMPTKEAAVTEIPWEQVENQNENPTKVLPPTVTITPPTVDGEDYSFTINDQNAAIDTKYYFQYGVFNDKNSNGIVDQDECVDYQTKAVNLRSNVTQPDLGNDRVTFTPNYELVVNNTLKDGEQLVWTVTDPSGNPVTGTDLETLLGISSTQASTAINTAVNNPMLTNLVPGTYKITLTIDDRIIDAPGVSSAKSQTISLQYIPLEITAEPRDCKDSSIKLMATIPLDANGDPIGSGNWSANPNTPGLVYSPNISSPEVTISNLQQGMTTFTWTYNPGDGTSIPSAIDYVVDYNGKATTIEIVSGTEDSTNNIRKLDQCTKDFNIDALETKDGEVGTWAIVSGDMNATIVTQPGESHLATVSLTVNTPTIISWTVAEADGSCPVKAPQDIMLTLTTDVAEAGAGLIADCGKSTVELAATPPKAGFQGSWQISASDAANLSIDPAEINNPNAIITATSSGDYKLTWLVDNIAKPGCQTTDDVMVSFEKILTVPASFDRIVCGSNETSLNGETLATGEEHLWTITTGDGSFSATADVKTSTEKNPKIYNLSYGINTLSYQATDATDQSCVGSPATINLDVKTQSESPCNDTLDMTNENIICTTYEKDIACGTSFTYTVCVEKQRCGVPESGKISVIVPSPSGDTNIDTKPLFVYLTSVKAEADCTDAMRAAGNCFKRADVTPNDFKTPGGGKKELGVFAGTGTDGFRVATFTGLNAFDDYKIEVGNTGGNLCNKTEAINLELSQSKIFAVKGATIPDCMGNGTGSQEIKVLSGNRNPVGVNQFITPQYSLDGGTTFEDFTVDNTNPADPKYTITGLQGGDYNPWIRLDANDNCPLTTINFTVISEPISFTISTTYDCDKDKGGIIVEDLKGGTMSGYQYAIIKDGKEIVSQTDLPDNRIIEPLDLGDYKIKISDDGGCDFTTSFSLESSKEIVPLQDFKLTKDADCSQGESGELTFKFKPEDYTEDAQAIDNTKAFLSTDSTQIGDEIPIAMDGVITVKDFIEGTYYLTVTSPNFCTIKQKVDTPKNPISLQVDVAIDCATDEATNTRGVAINLSNISAATTEALTIEIVWKDNPQWGWSTKLDPFESSYTFSPLSASINPDLKKTLQTSGEYQLILRQDQSDVCSTDGIKKIIDFTVPGSLTLEGQTIEEATKFEPTGSIKVTDITNGTPMSRDGASFYEVSISPDPNNIGTREIVEDDTGQFGFGFEKLSDGEYTINIIDSIGCVSKTNITVGVQPFMIPNVFTPNDDDKNQYFKLVGAPPEDVYLLITNRNGLILYESNNYTNDWDGKNVGFGVYFYEVKFLGQTFKGWVEILQP